MDLVQLQRLGRPLTSRDVQDLPHEPEVRVELIGGVLHVSTSPTWVHQRVVVRIAIHVGAAVLRAGGEGGTDAGVVWDDDGHDNVRPDLAFLTRSRGPSEGGLRVTPEIVVEVLSPGKENERRDRVFKRELYWRRGALEYWIADPVRRVLLRLTRGATDWQESSLSETDLLRTPLLPDWEGVVVAELFGP